MNVPTTLDPRLSVNEVLRLHPRTIAVFNELGVDACCGGADSLEDAAARAGISLTVLLEALQLCTAQDL